MRTPKYGVWVGFDVGTWIVRHLFPSGANFRISVAPLPEHPVLTCWTHAHRNAGIMGAFQRRRTPLGSRNAFPLVRAPVPKYILSPLQKFLSVFSGLYAWS